jgi:3-deoxy-D-manno-octulosonic-acid transferase
MNEKECQALKDEFHLQSTDLVLVIASTHRPEESEIIDTLDPLLKNYPQLKVLLVPRHPERFDEVARLLEARALPFHRYSQKNQCKLEKRFILVDTMGLLLKCYQIANFAIVGGSFTESVGGHNILEPCAYGVPVIFGPHMFSQPELLSLVTSYNAGKQVNLSELSSVLKDLIAVPSKQLEMSKNGLRLTHDARGASERTFSYLKDLFI